MYSSKKVAILILGRIRYLLKLRFFWMLLIRNEPVIGYFLIWFNVYNCLFKKKKLLLKSWKNKWNIDTTQKKHTEQCNQKNKWKLLNWILKMT